MVKLILKLVLNSVFSRNVKRVKKKQSKCKSYQAIKCCVFKVRSTDKQEMLHPKALLSTQTPQIMLNNDLERPCPLNVIAYPRTFDTTKPSVSYQMYENITVH